MNVISYINANRHEAAIISYDFRSSLRIIIAYDAKRKTINIELYKYDNTPVDFIAAKTVAAAKKALQEIAAKAYDIWPAQIFKKLAKSQAYSDIVPYETTSNHYAA